MVKFYTNFMHASNSLPIPYGNICRIFVKRAPSALEIFLFGPLAPKYGKTPYHGENFGDRTGISSRSCLGEEQRDWEGRGPPHNWVGVRTPRMLKICYDGVSILKKTMFLAKNGNFWAENTKLGQNWSSIVVFWDTFWDNICERLAL